MKRIKKEEENKEEEEAEEENKGAATSVCRNDEPCAAIYVSSAPPTDSGAAPMRRGAHPGAVKSKPEGSARGRPRRGYVMHKQLVAGKGKKSRGEGEKNVDERAR